MIASVAYGVGMGAVMVLAALLIVSFKDLVSRWIRVVMSYFEPIRKLAMVGGGAYLIYYWSLGDRSEILSLRTEQLFG